MADAVQESSVLDGVTRSGAGVIHARGGLLAQLHLHLHVAYLMIELVTSQTTRLGCDIVEVLCVPEHEADSLGRVLAIE